MLFYELYLCQIYNETFISIINSVFRIIIGELVDTEEEFSKDLQYVVDNYIKAVDKPVAPRSVKDNKDVIFSNFLQIAEFHNMYDL